jgi:hypothetical protein
METITITKKQLLEVFKNWPIDFSELKTLQDVIDMWQSEGYAEDCADHVWSELGE